MKHLISFVFITMLFITNIRGQSQSNVLDVSMPYGSYFASIDRDGVIIDTTQIYDHLIKLKRYKTPSRVGFGLARKNMKYAIIDSLGTVITPFAYKDVDFFDSEGLSPVGISGRWGFINNKGEQIVPYKYESCDAFFISGLYPVRLAGLWGAIDNNGKEVIPCIYDQIGGYNGGFNGQFVSVRKGKLRGIISITGKIAIPITYPYAEVSNSYFSDSHLSLVRVADEDSDGVRSGVIDKDGNVIVPWVYDYIQGSLEMKLANKGNKIAFMNGKAEFITPFIYDQGKVCSKGTGGIAKRDSMTFFIDSLGNESFATKGYMLESGGLIEMSTDSGTVFYDYFGNLTDNQEAKLKNTYTPSSVIIKSDYDRKLGLYGFVDKNNKLVISHQYLVVTPFYDEHAIVANKSKKSGLIDANGRIVIPLKYDGLEFIDMNRYLIKKGNKIAFVDAKGNFLTQFAYDIVENIDGELYQIKKNKKWGVADVNGKEIIPCLYDKANRKIPRTNLIEVEKNGKKGLINTATGSEVTPCVFDEIHGGELYVRKDNKWGVIDSTGSEIIPIIYDKIEIVGISSFLKVQNGQLWGLINQSGNFILPIEYDRIEKYYGNRLILTKTKLTIE